MKWTTPLVLAFCLAPGPFAYAQNPDDKDKPKQNPPRQEEPNRPGQQPERDNPPRQEPRNKPEPNKPEPPDKNKPSRQEEPKNQEQSDRDKRDKAKNGESNERENRDQKNAQSEDRNRASANEPRRGERRIPEDRFRASFGGGHTFHVHLEGAGTTGGRASRNESVEQNGPPPRFQYAGYWFELEEPWPVAWGYDDNCYIDYVDDDYYLFDDMHPGMRVYIIVID